MTNAPGPGLYLVATPIGAARDITLRALDLLGQVDILAAEDTRTLRRLLSIHGIAVRGRPIWAYHDHNGSRMRPRLLAALAEGRSVALTSDAGTPLVADPGFVLVREAVASGHAVHVAPGPSAVLAALSVSGLPTDRFLFAGFLPQAAGARRTFLHELKGVPATIVLFDTPRRCLENVREMVQVFGEDRQAAICRELTKRFQEVRRGSLGDLARDPDDLTPKGEIVVVVDRARGQATEEDMMDLLGEALSRLSVRDAADEVATALGLSKRRVYQAALKLERTR